MSGAAAASGEASANNIMSVMPRTFMARPPVVVVHDAIAGDFTKFAGIRRQVARCAVTSSPRLVFEAIHARDCVCTLHETRSSDLPSWRAAARSELIGLASQTISCRGIASSVLLMRMAREAVLSIIGVAGHAPCRYARLG
jgi:hypothetical protein